MNHNFEDITSVMGKPKWFDDHGFPRYCEFGPDEISNIYAKEVVFLLIACQNCGEQFKVAISTDGFNWRNGQKHSFKEAILDHGIGYGDPPNVGCCDMGVTMTSEPVRVLQFWQRYNDGNWEWNRNPFYEIDVYDYEDKI